MYPPSYVSMLKSRSSIPLVRTFPSSPDPRLILLSAEVPLLEEASASTTSSTSVLPGRPLTAHYSSLAQKIHFMDRHNIAISVLSLANPWLDFLSPSESPEIAFQTNVSFSEMCGLHPGRLYFFGTLPLTAPLPAILACISHLSSLKYCRGVILGTSGLGTGLDDPDLLPIFNALAAANLTIFLHPHYGLPNEVFGPAERQKQYGHVLPLALGFPMETTIAVTRMFLSGVFDAVPKLQMILAHSGGTLPFLAGRIESCVAHDGHLFNQSGGGKKRRTIWEVLKSQIYLDAVVYSDVGIQAAVAASGPEGTDRLMFGTDHPFFPPLGTDEQGQWESVSLNAEAVKKALGEGDKADNVMGGNAIQVLRLYGE